MPSEMVGVIAHGILPTDPFQFIDVGKAREAGLMTTNGPELAPGEHYLMSRWFCVHVNKVEAKGWPGGHVLWLSIRRQDRRPIRDWRHLQKIKNAICGPETEAMEMFPAESRLVDTSNQYHLWVLADEARFPFGYRERGVLTPEQGERVDREHFGGEGINAVQRPFTEWVEFHTCRNDDPRLSNTEEECPACQAEKAADAAHAHDIDALLNPSGGGGSSSGSDVDAPNLS